jgi:hypothetical protein
MLSLDLYDDDNGKPGSLVGELGTLDPLSLVRGDGEYSFDTPVSDLTPESTYHLVFSHDGANWGDPGRRVFWSLTRTPGQPGAGEAMAVDPLFGVEEWHNLHGFPIGGPPFSVWFYAQVEATLGQFIDADFDHDGVLTAADIDLLSAELRTPSGDPRFDINNDGQVDVDDHRDWVHESNIGDTYFGDANLDGEFNSGDLIAVFQAGEYEDQITLNSTWAEGDWDGDGEFDSGDLVFAFQDGGYGMGPRAAVAAVPQPSGWILLTLGLIGIVRIRSGR